TGVQTCALPISTSAWSRGSTPAVEPALTPPPPKTTVSAGSTAGVLPRDHALVEEIPRHGRRVRIGSLGREPAGALTCFAFAAREVEVRIERAPLLEETRAAQDELVRVEQPAQVRVGQEPSVRRIACALEAVELEGGERVAR